MDSSPITAWKDATAYFTFANHESVVLMILLISVAMTAYIIGDIMRHEKKAEMAHGLSYETAEEAGLAEFSVSVDE